MNQSSLLFLLQNIDSEIDKAKMRISEIDILLESDETLKSAQNRITENKKAIHAQENQLNAISSELDDLKIKQKTSENSMYSGKIQSPKELQDLQNEIDFLKKRIASINNSELEIMIQIDASEQELANAENDFVRIKSETATTASMLKGEKSKLDLEIAQALQQRQATVNSITSENLAIYQRLYQSKRGVVVSKIIDDACSACGTHIRPAEKQASNNPTQMAYCSSCGRILSSG
ncbi:MAG: hypothetical protein HPY76_04755 [Anaerolineae bacterium]|nr:hypothetical protein [Anaerolineae bacterium]